MIATRQFVAVYLEGGIQVISFAQCGAFAGLAANEMFLGVAPSNTQRLLLSNYLMNLWRGPQIVRRLIVADIRASLNVGALKQAADLLIVLRRFLFDYPEARLANR
jgi:hypothetical protein